MNNCFISGKIITKIEFKFAIKNKFYSIAEFKIELDNKSIIKARCRLFCKQGRHLAFI